jgi:DNA-binding LacI/PurR family transcriptional regulator
MRDIGAVAGVSHSTVSRVLNNAPSMIAIPPRTRERVQSAARQLGYRPNPHARSLRGAPTKLLGSIVRDFSDAFFAGAIEALAVEAMAHGYNVVLGHAQGHLEEAIALPAVLEIRHTDAVVLMGDMQDQPKLLADLRNSLVPVVALWQGSSPIEFPTVDVDDRGGIVTAVEHLLGLGHRRIACVSAGLPGGNPHRENAYIEAMGSRFSDMPNGYIQRVENALSGGEDALAVLLGQPEPPTAIVATTDLVAIGVLHAAHRLGCSVPRDLSVVGFDDIPIAAHTVPALTTLRMPIPEMVGTAVGLAIALARDPSVPRVPSVQVFEPKLILRDSTAPPRSAAP